MANLEERIYYNKLRSVTVNKNRRIHVLTHLSAFVTENCVHTYTQLAIVSVGVPAYNFGV